MARRPRPFNEEDFEDLQEGRASKSEQKRHVQRMAALAEQLAETIPQGQYPNDYWTLATALGDSIIAGEYDNASDDELMTVLEEFQSTCQSYAQ